MKKIEYITGDATQPQGIENKIIVHVCNDIGKWGKGFVLAISKRWKTPEKSYKEWYASQKDFELGEVQFIKVEDDLWVANLIGQHKIGMSKQGIPPIRYKAIEEGMQKVAHEAEKLNASVHMPRVGCGLAGGKWKNIEPILKESLIKNKIKTVVYDF